MVLRKEAYQAPKTSMEEAKKRSHVLRLEHHAASCSRKRGFPVKLAWKLPIRELEAGDGWERPEKGPDSWPSQKEAGLHDDHDILGAAVLGVPRLLLAASITEQSDVIQAPNRWFLCCDCKEGQRSRYSK